jgi:ribulose 1,5-bisphosphate synthetase/thiazole synthase
MTISDSATGDSDILVVGAGTAGCVITAWLCEGPVAIRVHLGVET